MKGVDPAKKRFDQKTQVFDQRHAIKIKESPHCVVRKINPPLVSEFKKDAVQKHWHILDSDPNLKNVFTEKPKHVFKRCP